MPDALTAAVVGCGGAGTNHARGYRNAAGARLVAVCDVDADRAGAVAEEFDVSAYGSVDDLLSAEAPDLVSVATPERHHVEPAVAALEGGADVLCEKIMAESLDRGREMVDAAERTGRTLAVDYNYRHMPAFAELADALDRSALGEVHLATADVHAYGWHHVLDLFRFLLGEPRSVRAHLDHDPGAVAERFRLDGPLYVPSHAVSATVEFASGATASVSSSIHTDLATHLIDLAVYGEAGRVRLTGVTPEDSTGSVAPGPLADALRAADSITLEEAFERSVAAFVDAIRRGERPPTTGTDGLAVLELETAVVDSAERGAAIEL
jgi:predicted dehydrogenase